MDHPLTPKRVEFRRKLGNSLPGANEKVFVYRSQKDQGLVGYFETIVAQGRPDKLWATYGTRSGMVWPQYNKYL